MEIGLLMGGLVIFEVLLLYRGEGGMVGGGVRLGDLGEGRKGGEGTDGGALCYGCYGGILMN